MELAKIFECMDKKKLTVPPMFHYVDPSDVRYQRGSFAEAFAKHENRFKDKIDDVKTWRAALTAVANLSGWHLKDNSESEVTKKIIQRRNSELDREVPLVSKHLVGMDSRVEEFLDLCLDERLDCVRSVGIWGMGGIGKATLVREIYNRIFHDFEVSSFIANVREKSKSRGLVSLQKNILSKILMGAEKNISDVEEGKKILRKSLCNKKVLIVLDNVSEKKQLEALAGKNEWFGVGSRVIVTSRDRHLLRWSGVDAIFEVKGLNDSDALHLFSWKAFKKPYPEENYMALSMQFVRYAQGHPLALEVLGSSLLFCRSPNLWESTLGRIKENPRADIFDVLKICFDGLEEREKSLFLDVACFFKGLEFNSRLTHILEKLYDKPEIYIDSLQKKSLITITREGFQMHDLLQEMGRDIVRHELGKEIACHRESPEEVARRSRL